MNKSLFIFFGCLALFAAGGAKPAQALECGKPESAELKADSVEYCDIHQRRLAYKTSADNFTKLIETRRQAYETPRREAQEAYEKSIGVSQDGSFNP